MQLFLNFIQHPKTTIAGLLSGSVSGVTAMAAVSMISTQAGCDFASVDWIGVTEVVTGSTVVGGLVGGFFRDTRKAVAAPTA